MARQWLVTFLKLIKSNTSGQEVQDVVMRKFLYNENGEMLIATPRPKTNYTKLYNQILFNLLYCEQLSGV